MSGLILFGSRGLAEGTLSIKGHNQPVDQIG